MIRYHLSAEPQVFVVYILIGPAEQQPLRLHKYKNNTTEGNNWQGHWHEPRKPTPRAGTALWAESRTPSGGDNILQKNTETAKRGWPRCRPRNLARWYMFLAQENLGVRNDAVWSEGNFAPRSSSSARTKRNKRRKPSTPENNTIHKRAARTVLVLQSH